jgi:taurine dioxygenase
MRTVLRERLVVKPVTGRLGAIVEGIDLGEPLNDCGKADIMHLLVEHKVLFFRDQSLDRAQHLALGRSLGELEINPISAKSGAFASDENDPEVVLVKSDEKNQAATDQWHSDVTWREKPSLGSILRCVITPPAGGDTLWADMEAIYDDLDDETKERLSGLTATNDWWGNSPSMKALGEERLAELRKEHPPMAHPVVRIHPVSGRKCIYVNPAYTRHIDGLDKDESAALLNRLYALTWRPEYNVRFRWEPGSVAFWDNRSTQHYVAADFFPQRRLMERVTLAGTERPR